MTAIKDFSKDIHVFRNMVERSISPKLYQLDKELNRLRALPPKCEERFHIKLYGKLFYKNNLYFLGYLKAHGLDIIENASRLFKQFSGEDLPYDWYVDKKSHFEQRIEDAKTHEEELMQVTRDVTDFCERVRSEFVRDATIKYSKRKKLCAALDEETYGIRTDVIPSTSEIQGFLLSIRQMDPALRETILGVLSECAGFSIRDAIIANDGEAVSSYITQLDDKYYPFAFEVSALNSGLQERGGVFQAIDQCLNTCGKIDEKYYVGWYSAVHDLPKDISSLCSKNADSDLSSRIAKTGYLYSQDEIDAIAGQTSLPKPTDIREKTYADPGLQDPAEYFLGLKESLKDLTKLHRIAKITSEVGFISHAAIPQFVFRMSGNCRPETLDVIKWTPALSKANRHKSSPNTHRHPYELYYLLAFMFENTAGLEGKVSKFFDIDKETLEKARPILRGEKKAKLPQMAKMADKEFQQKLHKVDSTTFPVLRQ